MTASQHTIAGTVITMPVQIRKATQHMAMFSVDADAAQHLGVVALAQLGYQDADGVRPTVAQGAGQQAGLIVQFLRSRLDAITCGLGNGAARHIVEHHGDGRWT